QKGQQLDGGIQTGEESTGVEGDQARNGSVGAWSGVGIARSCGALTPVALRAPSVSAPQDLLTLLRRGTSYFALTVGPPNAADQWYMPPEVGSAEHNSAMLRATRSVPAVASGQPKVISRGPPIVKP